MGSGKSTIGKELARRLDRAFIDTDERIETAQKMEIIEIFAKKGEAWFRIYEEKVVHELISSARQAVISLGGGTLLSQKTTDFVLASGILIYIKSEPEEIYKRIKHSSRRPLLRLEGNVWQKKAYMERVAQLMRQREKGYAHAHICIDRDGKEVNEIVDEIVNKLSGFQVNPTDKKSKKIK